MNLFVTSWYGDLVFSNPIVQQKICLWPRRDVLTGKWLWLCKVVHIGSRVRVDMNVFYQHYYTRPEQWTMLLLKGSALCCTV